MSLIDRIKAILLKPRETWPVIEAEEATPAGLYMNYLIYLAAIPAICSFIGMSIIGIGGFGFSIRVPFLWGLVNMVVQYVLSLVMIYVFALIINALAPTFGGQKNMLNALKLSVYGVTASMVGGIFGLIPLMGLLSVLCGLYSIYLIYLGLPVLMKNPQDKSVLYTIVVLLVGIVCGMILAMVSAVVTPSVNPYKLGKGGDTVISMKTPGGELKIDTAKIDEATRQMEEAQKRMEAAQKSGDTAGMAKAGGDAAAAAAGMMGGDANVLPIPTDALKNFLLPSIPPFQRTSVEAHATTAGFVVSEATADYQAGDRSMRLKISDSGGLSGLVRLGGSMVVGERETTTSAEKTWQENGRTLHYKSYKDGSSSEYRIILKNGVIVEMSGNRVTADSLKPLILMVDLNGLENFPRPRKS